MTCSSVDLPQPDGPNRAICSPASTVQAGMSRTVNDIAVEGVPDFQVGHFDNLHVSHSNCLGRPRKRG